MADYTIYVLDESDMTIDGAELDGITQGDGSHMLGATITLNAASWHPIEITDNDADFADSDGSQRLAGAQTVDGTTYAAGTRVEAEYGLTLTDGVNQWQVVAFNVNDTSPAYATNEGLAFIGGPGGFPPVGVPLRVTAAREGPRYAASAYATPLCLVAGTRILTPTGERRVETLQPGDRVVTRDHGVQTLRWTGRQQMWTDRRFAPIEIAAGALSNSRPIYVSPQHRMLITDWRAELLFGEAEVLVPAVRLINDTTIRQCLQGWVTYVHLLFDRHEIIFAEGAPTESFYPGAMALNALDKCARDEVMTLFPELERCFGPTARRCLLGHEASLLTPGIS